MLSNESLPEVRMGFRPGEADCSVDGCPNPAAKSGLCEGHVKRRTRGQVVSAALKLRPRSPLERLTEAALAYANAESDDEFDRAKDNLRKSAAAFAPNDRSTAIREALAELKRRGLKLGRPRKVEPEVAVRMVEQEGGVRKAALVLRVSRMAVSRALREAGKPAP